MDEVWGRPLALVLFALEAHLVDPSRRIVDDKLVGVRVGCIARSGCLNFKNAVILFVEYHLFADFSALNIFLEEKVIELADNLERQEVFDNINDGTREHNN